MKKVKGKNGKKCSCFCGASLDKRGAGWYTNNIAENDKMLFFKKLTTEYMENPIGLPLDRVRFGWIVSADGRNEKQTA